jgi:peptidoglycan DL-endopeptidase CwlO
VSDEQTPDPLGDLFANLGANPPSASNYSASNSSVPNPSGPGATTPHHTESTPLVPAPPQFTSRRELNAASSRRRSAKSSAAASSPKGRTSNLSRRDEAAVRKLAAMPRITPARDAKPSKFGGAQKDRKRNPLKVAFVLLVVAGFGVGVTFPALASANSPSTAGATPNLKQGQSVRVDASIQTATVARDDISATSESELKTEEINAATLASAPGVRQPGDDYPWRTAGYGLSPLDYYYRQCVDFVAWRLNRDAGVTSAPWKWTWSTLTPNGGDASQWKAAWIAHGWKTSATPIVGSVAWFVGDHVAYVHSISGANVTIEEYNGTSTRAYAERTIPISSVGRFLYPPP